MKCLLCEFNSNETQKLRDHYIAQHKVDIENQFFKKLFDEKKNIFYGKKCVRCGEFLPTTRYKNYHDFLKHYESGKNIIEEKPLIVSNIGSVKKFEITHQAHSQYYDFYNSENLVDEFLFNVKNKIQRTDVDFYVKAGFSLENIQSSVDDSDLLTSSRYWSTEPIQTKLFNDFVFFNIRGSILKRVINNGMTGSSWHFNRFLYINIKIIKVTDQFVR